MPSWPIDKIGTNRCTIVWPRFRRDISLSAPDTMPGYVTNTMIEITDNRVVVLAVEICNSYAPILGYKQAKKELGYMPRGRRGCTRMQRQSSCAALRGKWKFPFDCILARSCCSESAVSWAFFVEKLRFYVRWKISPGTQFWLALIGNEIWDAASLDNSWIITSSKCNVRTSKVDNFEDKLKRAIYDYKLIKLFISLKLKMGVLISRE